MTFYSTTGARLALTLRYLAAGDSLKSVAFAFRVGSSTASEIVIDVSEALFKVLKPDCLKHPSKPEEWRRKAVEFYNRWNFPNCVGAIDRKYISIQCPPNSDCSYIP